MPSDDNINAGPLGQQSGNYLIQSHYETGDASAQQAGHFQIMGLGFQGAGATWDLAEITNGYPVQLSTGSLAALQVADVWGCIGTGSGYVAGGSCMNVDVVSSAGLTIHAIIEDLIVGITSGVTGASIGVYGTGATAVGVTGTVYLIGTGDIQSFTGVPVFGTGGAAVGVTGYVGVTTDTGIYVYGTGPWATGGAVGVTGTILIDDSSLIGISGGISLDGVSDVKAQISDGMTHGGIVTGLDAGMTLSGIVSWGLTSGVRVQAYATGTSAEYVYVGGGTSTGLVTDGYPLREFDSLFIEIDNLNKVYVISDNSAAQIRYIGS